MKMSLKQSGSCEIILARAQNNQTNHVVVVF